jgi:hypothetical protein
VALQNLQCEETTQVMVAVLVVAAEPILNSYITNKLAAVLAEVLITTELLAVQTLTVAVAVAVAGELLVVVPERLEVEQSH